MVDRRVYVSIRDLHLYGGLFISPFLLVFAVSVLFLNHAHTASPPAVERVTSQDLRLPDGVEQWQGREAVDRLQSLLPQLGLTGEIGFLRSLPKERRLVFPVSRAGFEATVDLDVAARSAVVTRRKTGWLERVAYLHKSPGPHNVAIRGNWIGTRRWAWFADLTVYLTLFISISGIYLWYAIKAERRIGFWLLGAGAAWFFGMIYAVIR